MLEQRTSTDDVDWPTCHEDGCIGIRLASGEACLAHAGAQDREAELDRVRNTGFIDVRGITVSSRLLRLLLAAAPRDAPDSDRHQYSVIREQDPDPDRPCLREARFDRATFGERSLFDQVNFENVSFMGPATFTGATFQAQARFGGAVFEVFAQYDHATFHMGVQLWGGNLNRRGDLRACAVFHEAAFFNAANLGPGADFRGTSFGNAALFSDATFTYQAWFDGCTFDGSASFRGATLGHDAGFSGVSFKAAANFAGARFGNLAKFAGASFHGYADFSSASFGREARLDRASFAVASSFAGSTFGDRASFQGTQFGAEADFEAATFGGLARFGPLAGDRLVLDLATFGQGCELTINANELDCEGLRVPEGAAMNIICADIRLDGARFGRPTVLAGGTLPQAIGRPRRPGADKPWRTGLPRVLSLRGADVSNLTLSDVDLQACRFEGAHNLDQLHLQGTVDLPYSPTGLRAGLAIPPLWRWTRRRTLSDEHRWRFDRARGSGWYPPACRSYDEGIPQPGDIARLYRALRKGLEDAKNASGAADFYYGEMEMRRHDQTAPWSERIVVWLYWLVAGYGLRASRALGWLLAVLAVSTVSLATVGFPPESPPPLTATITGTPLEQRVVFDTAPGSVTTAQHPMPDRLGAAMLVAIEGAVFRRSEQPLTHQGRVVQIGLRLVGPLLLGLTLLSIRGRVRR